MATEKIVFDTEINVGNSTNSVKGLKQELRDITRQLGTLEQGSQAFNDAAERAGALREQIRGVNDAIENADPEKKFAPFARTIQGLAGGFAAVQGAMGLFGAESKDLEKTLLKVQSAMALSQGLNSLLEFKNDFKDLGKIIVNKVITAFTTLKGAIAATGIGLLVITIATLVANWDKLSAAITDSFPGFKVVIDFFKNIQQVGAGTLASLTEGFKIIGSVVANIFKGDFSEAKKEAENFGSRVSEAYNKGFEVEDKKIKLENGIKDRKFALDLEEAKGKDIKNKRIKLMQDELSLLKKGSEEYNAKLIEIEAAKTAIRKEANDKQLAAEKAIQDKKIEEAKSDFEFYKNLAAEKAKKDKEDLEKKKEEEGAMIDAELSSLMAQAETRVSIDKKEKDAKKLIEEDLIKARQEAFAVTSNLLGSLSDLAGRNTAEGKALAIAQASIDTYQAASSIFTAAAKSPLTTAFPAYPFIAAGAAIVAGIARVNAIASVQVPNGGGGGGGGITAPPVPQIPQSLSGTRLSQTDPLRTTNEGRDTKVIVTETDITKTQNKVRNIIKKATIK